MQLKHGKMVGLLSAATASLLPGATQAADAWDIDSAVLYYAESDGRISAFEPVISAKKDLGDDEILSMKLVVDSLTGSSASGAVPSTQAQTFTRPSGDGSYVVDPNETPLDPSFKDTRVAYSLNWDKPLDRVTRRNLGFNVSQEFDFTSLSGNAVWTLDTHLKNTTWTWGINVELDELDPVGGAPVPLTLLAAQNKAGDESRDIVDLLFGVTQVIDKTSLFQINLSLSEADGYLTDPYKIVSRVDATGQPTSQLFEKRPDSRSRQSLYGKYKKMFVGEDIFTASYRYLSDDWGIDSSTFDVTYRFKLDSSYFVEPHLRWYQQSEADFYRFFLRDTESVPDFVSADYRLGEMQANTIGVKFGRIFDEKHSWSAGLEYYVQSGDSSPPEAFGQLDRQDLYPDVKATLVQFNYSFKW